MYAKNPCLQALPAQGKCCIKSATDYEDDYFFIVRGDFLCFLV